MAPIVSSIEIARPPEEVFAYVTDGSRLGEWQEGVVSSTAERKALPPSAPGPSPPAGSAAASGR